MSVFDASSTSRRAPESSLPISRRRLLLGSAGAMASVSLLGLSPLARSEEPKTLPDYVRWKNANDVIVHSANTIETERGAIGSGVVTNSDKLNRLKKRQNNDIKKIIRGSRSKYRNRI